MIVSLYYLNFLVSEYVILTRNKIFFNCKTWFQSNKLCNRTKSENDNCTFLEKSRAEQWEVQYYVDDVVGFREVVNKVPNTGNRAFGDKISIVFIAAAVLNAFSESAWLF